MTPLNPESEYAIWAIPGTDFAVQYALGAFHEIDFQVNEGYRRIPHGGIEIGGLFFGRFDKRTSSIDAFRLIECEHVSGPSFNLSDRDLSKLDLQIKDAKTDPDLKDLVPVGWFIAHTRSPLRMSEKELALFDRYFPDPGKIAVLVKPERFQPTRFGFLVREASGRIKTDASEQAIILPLSGRGAGTRPGSGPIASIAAPPRPEPTVKSADDPAARVPEKSAVHAEAAPQPPLANETPKEAARRPQTSRLWARDVGLAKDLEAPNASTNSEALVSPPLSRDSSAKEMQDPVSTERTSKPITRPLGNALPFPDAPSELEGKPATNLSALPTSALPSLDEIRKRRSPDLNPTPTEDRPRSRRTQPLLSEPKIWNLRLTAVLILAAALGCGVGYLGYLQLPSAIIPVKVRKRPSALLVSWPPEQTHDAVYASIRVDDGQPMALTAEEKASGVTEVRSTAANIKIELISKHWMRDSRGIVRYVKAPGGTAAPAGTLSNDAANPVR